MVRGRNARTSRRTPGDRRPWGRTPSASQWRAAGRARGPCWPSDSHRLDGWGDAYRSEVEVLPDGLRYRRPVVGERDLSLGRTQWCEVVTPEPAAELQVTVALGVVPRQPANGARRVEHVDLVGRLIVTVWMVGVMHTDRKWRYSRMDCGTADQS